MCRGCKGESNQNARMCEAQKERASDGSRRRIRVRRSRKTMGTDRKPTCEVQEAAEESEGRGDVHGTRRCIRSQIAKRAEAAEAGCTRPEAVRMVRMEWDGVRRNQTRRRASMHACKREPSGRRTKALAHKRARCE